jgi:uncharacterized protein YpuA (DUF1002 family)
VFTTFYNYLDAREDYQELINKIKIINHRSKYTLKGGDNKRTLKKILFEIMNENDANLLYKQFERTVKEKAKRSNPIPSHIKYFKPKGVFGVFFAYLRSTNNKELIPEIIDNFLSDDIKKRLVNNNKPNAHIHIMAGLANEQTEQALVKVLTDMNISEKQANQLIINAKEYLKKMTGHNDSISRLLSNYRKNRTSDRKQNKKLRSVRSVQGGLPSLGKKA